MPHISVLLQRMKNAFVFCRLAWNRPAQPVSGSGYGRPRARPSKGVPVQASTDIQMGCLSTAEPLCAAGCPAGLRVACWRAGMRHRDGTVGCSLSARWFEGEKVKRPVEAAWGLPLICRFSNDAGMHRSWPGCDAGNPLPRHPRRRRGPCAVFSSCLSFGL